MLGILGQETTGGTGGMGTVESDVHERTAGQRAGRRSFHVMQTQRDAMMLKQSEHLVCIPRRLAEFDGVTASSRQRLQKRFETGEARRRQWPARRPLIKDRPERRSEPFCTRKEEVTREARTERVSLLREAEERRRKINERMDRKIAKLADGLNRR